MNFREILGEITDFCSENYIWVILMAVVLATVFIAAVLHGRKKNTGTAMRESSPGQKKMTGWMVLSSGWQHLNGGKVAPGRK